MEKPPELLVRENQHAQNENRMNKNKIENSEDEMRPEYDLSQLKGRVRGKYVERYRAGTNLVLLESDVQAAFPDAEAVNEALRMLMKVARRQTQERVWLYVTECRTIQWTWGRGQLLSFCVVC